MIKITKKGFTFIICTTFVVVLLGLLGWATSGFVNWNSATWFNNWGKGKSVKPVEQPVEQCAMVMTSANAGLTYDSDEVEKTVAVTVLDSPDYQLVTNKPTFFEMGMGFYTKGLWGNKLSISISLGGYDDSVYYSKEFTYSGANVGTSAVSEQHFLSFGEIFNNSEDTFLNAFSGEKIIVVTACNVGFGDYLNSVGLHKYVYVPDMAQSNLLGMFDGTTFKIPLPYEYRSAGSVMGSPGSSKYFDFVVADGNKNTAYNFDVFCGSAFGGDKTNIIACVRDIDDNAAFENSHSISSLSATLDESNMYNIDLTQLSFSSMLTSEAHIYVIPRYNFSYYDCDVVLPKYDYAFSISKLATPTNVTFSNGILTWDEVDGARGYGVFFGNGGGRVVDKPEVDLSDIVTESGYYTFRVRALGNVGKSLSESQAANVMTASMLSAYNANSNIVQLVVLTYEVNGDTITKFVPMGAKLSTYLYEVNVPNKEFYGWYYDSGFSRKVENSDTLSEDTVIYARLTDIKVTERPLSWWDQNKWYVLIPCFVFVGIGIVVAVVVGIRKRKAA